MHFNYNGIEPKYVDNRYIVSNQQNPKDLTPSNFNFKVKSKQSTLLIAEKKYKMYNMIYKRLIKDDTKFLNKFL